MGSRNDFPSLPAEPVGERRTLPPGARHESETTHLTSGPAQPINYDSPSTRPIPAKNVSAPSVSAARLATGSPAARPVPSSSFLPLASYPLRSPPSPYAIVETTPRRSLTSPSLRSINDNFLATPSINDSYAPREDPILSSSPDQYFELMRERNNRTSLIPSFTPAAAFSKGDRGPYLSTGALRRTSTRSLSTENNDYFVGVGSGTVNTSGKGKARASLIEEQEVVDDPEEVNETKGKERVDMVGVGRNSFIGTPHLSFPLSSPKSRQNAITPLPPPPLLPLNGIPSSSPAPKASLRREPSICVECMMRDRDMADIDVTGKGVWDRESDFDLREMLQREDEEIEAEGSRNRTVGEEGIHTDVGTLESGEGSRKTDEGDNVRSSWSIQRPPSSSLHGSSSLGGASGSSKRRIGRGEALTMASLKLWTSMNIAASTHRSRTLKLFLVEANALLDQQALEAQMDSSSIRHLAMSTGAESQLEGHRPPTALSNTRQRSRTSPADEKFIRPISTSVPIPINPALTNNVWSYSSGDQPWLAQSRRQSIVDMQNGISPSMRTTFTTGMTRQSLDYARSSSSDIRSVSHMGGKDDRRSSLWSRFRRGGDASASVLSLAPSGSMMDMHLGLSMDKHAELAERTRGPYDQYGSNRSDPMIRSLDDGSGFGEMRWNAVGSYRGPSIRSTMSPPLKVKDEKKKKGIKGFFSKLISSHNGRGDSSSTPDEWDNEGGVSRHAGNDRYSSRPRSLLEYSGDDNNFLPPPPLSILTNQPNPSYASRTHRAPSLDAEANSLSNHNSPDGGSFATAPSAILGSPSRNPQSNTHSQKSQIAASDLNQYVFVPKPRNPEPSSRQQPQHHHQPQQRNQQFPLYARDDYPLLNRRASTSTPTFSTSTPTFTPPMRMDKSLPPAPPRSPADSWSNRSNGAVISTSPSSVEDLGGGEKNRAKNEVFSLNFGVTAAAKRRETGQG